MTCLNPVAKPPTAQGKDSTSSMAAGLHNCTTGQKDKSFRAVASVGAECDVAGSAPTCTIPLWRQPVPTEFLRTGYCGFISAGRPPGFGTRGPLSRFPTWRIRCN
jgi:hypothetical protein